MATPIIPTGIDTQESCTSNYFNRELKDFIDNPHVTAGTEYSVKADGKTIDMEWTSKIWESPFCAIFAHPFEFAYCDVWTTKIHYRLFMDGDLPKCALAVCDDGGCNTPQYGRINPGVIEETGFFLDAMVKSGESEETVAPIKAFLIAVKMTLDPALQYPGLSPVSEEEAAIEPLKSFLKEYCEQTIPVD